MPAWPKYEGLAHRSEVQLPCSAADTAFPPPQLLLWLPFDLWVEQYGKCGAVRCTCADGVLQLPVWYIHV